MYIVYKNVMVLNVKPDSMYSNTELQNMPTLKCTKIFANGNDNHVSSMQWVS